MLAIRMQRTGRKGHPMFRVVVQDTRLTPTSGRVVAQIGHYDPHTKAVTLNNEKAAFYLEHGAQPTPRAVVLLKSQGVKLPKWAIVPAKKEGKIRNPEKLRRNRPAEPEAPVEEPVAETEPAPETPAEDTTPVAEAAEEVVAEAPTEETEEQTEA